VTPDLDSRPACVQVAGHVPAVAAKGGNFVAPSHPLLPPGWLSLQGAEVGRQVRLGVCRVQMAQETHLRVVPGAFLSGRVAALRRALVSLAQMVQATDLLVPRAFLSGRAAVVPQV
jgi:hypothetical protein